MRFFCAFSGAFFSCSWFLVYVFFVLFFVLSLVLFFGECVRQFVLFFCAFLVLFFVLVFVVFRKENHTLLFPKQGKPAKFVVVRLSLCFFCAFSGAFFCARVF